MPGGVRRRPTARLAASGGARRGRAPRQTGRVHIPPGLRRNVEHHPLGPAWLAALPDLRERLAARWGLVVGAPFTAGVAAWTAPARTREGVDVVLKISLPHDEARGEADALRYWAGHGAVALLAHAPDDWALLLERCRPGTALAEEPAPDDARLRSGAHVLAALLGASGTDRAGGPVAGPAAGARSTSVPAAIRPMGPACASGADVLVRTADAAARRPEAGLRVDRGQVGAAAALLRGLPAAGPGGVVVHGDLNPGNVLRTRGAPGSGRPWLAIDPKPLVGDPAYDPWPLVSQVGAPFDAADPATALRARTELVAGEAGLDPGRVLAWSFARSVQSAYWFVAESRWAPAAAELARARVWGRLAG